MLPQLGLVQILGNDCDTASPKQLEIFLWECGSITNEQDQTAKNCK